MSKALEEAISYEQNTADTLQSSIVNRGYWHSAEYHQQIATWLRELNTLRALKDTKVIELSGFLTLREREDLEKALGKCRFVYSEESVLSMNMDHYKQGKADAIAEANGELMQAFNPD